MEVRRATLNDLGPLLDFLEKYHEESNLSDIPVRRPDLARLLEFCIKSSDSVGLVARDENKVYGALFGTIEPFFFNSKKTYATDMFFISKGAGPQLWKEFKEWGLGMGAERILMGVSSGDPRAEQLLEVLGMDRTGGMYVLRK